MNINVFLFFFSFVFLQIERERERERERGYIKLGIRRNGRKVYLSFFFFFRRSSCGEYFLFYGLIDFMLFLILAWRKWLLRVRDILFVFFYPEYLAFGSVRHEPCPTTNFVFSFFRWREEGATSPFLGSQPIIWLLPSFLPVSGDPREVTEYKHLFLTVILWRLATVNSNTRIVVILFLSSQWDTTWHLEYSEYWPHLYCCTLNVSVDMSIQMFHVELGESTQNVEPNPLFEQSE